ncbi:hypothetical protein DPMN_174352 [Dreissena polymorpha]|uniref:Uncharacterized protein n=1 Tax=Dreissena polymorpha TaxID=45954 RepID=A0A9D4E391_DREPO|nr:hypothetical protein DPMN_174352 [Dreissena polymorpha]
MFQEGVDYDGSASSGAEEGSFPNKVEEGTEKHAINDGIYPVKASFKNTIVQKCA